MIHSVKYSLDDLKHQELLIAHLQRDIKFIHEHYFKDECRDLIIKEFIGMIKEEKKLLKNIQNQLKQII